MDNKLAALIRKLYGLGGQYVKDAMPGGSLNPEWTPERTQTALSGMMDVTPVVGDVKSAYEGVQAAREGDMVGAGLGALGALPFVPNMAGVVKNLPLKPGLSEIPEGMVRLYHQTSPEALEAIKKEGIKLSKAKGIEGPKGIYADEKGFYGNPEDYPTVEIMVPKDKWQQPFVLDDVPSSSILGTHEPWHRIARYLLDPSNKQMLDAALSGKLDKRGGDTAKAVEYVKEFIKQGQ
jgi:hypothetical protein